jgi:2-polyprenyl-3-methyl-5-hydroxy-6-metoxy-1,4-benzoquinol methylase
MSAVVAACPVCRSHETGVLAGPQTRWRYRRCDGCGHLWLDPMPTAAELERYYNSAYSVPLERYAGRVAVEQPVVRAVVERAAPPGRTMLEVGCSYGLMLQRFAADGWDVEGVELDARSAAHARDVLGLQVYQGRLEDTPAVTSREHAVIAMYHVLEHIDDPRAFLELIASTCMPGGLLVLKTPNAASVPARLLGGWWEWTAAPEHVHVFTPESLTLLLRQTGWAPLDTRTRRGDAHGTVFELARGAARRLSGRPPRGEEVLGEGNRQAAVRTPPSARGWYRSVERAVNVLGAPVDWMLDAAGAGSPVGPELLAVARRQPCEARP